MEEPEGDQLGEIAARGRGLTAADLRVAVSRLIDRGTAQRRRQVRHPSAPPGRDEAGRAPVAGGVEPRGKTG